MVYGMTARFTSADPITIERDGEQQVIDFVARTVTVDGVARPFDDVDAALFPTVAQIEAFAAEDAAITAREQTKDAAHDAAEATRQQMFDLTESIIDWCENTSAFLFSGGQYGVVDVPAYIGLLQGAEAALLASKALTIRTERVAEQERWMLQRGQQAQSLLGLAAVLG